LYASRIRELKYLGMGPQINSLYFGYNNPLFGPNPQIFVEAVVLFKDYFFIFYFLVVLILFFTRKVPQNAFSFSLIASGFISIIIDSQLAFYNLFNILLAYFLALSYILVKKLFFYNRRKL
jgi:hypothetical protein